MHPVLAKAFDPLVEEIETASLEELQISPDLTFQRWCAQEVVEHLILSLKTSREELQHRLSTKAYPSRSTNIYQRIIKLHVCWFGWMPNGVPALQSLEPVQFAPQDGPVLAVRLLWEADELSKILAECRIVFGMLPCGYHPMCGVLRVEEWRSYHAVQCHHHTRQFREAVDFARKHPEQMRLSKTGIERMVTDAGHEE